MAFKFNPFTGSLDNVVDRASKTKYQRSDASKKNIDAASDDVESALNNLDDAVGTLDATPTNYSPTDPAIVSDHLQGIDNELGNLSSSIQNFEWQPSVLTVGTTTPPGAPTTGDRYLIGLDTTASIATGAWAGEDGNIAEWNGSSWDFTTPTTGMFVAADDEGDRLYLFGSTAWTAKYFESTTVSDTNSIDLTKNTFDISADIRLSTVGADAGNLKVTTDVQSDGIRSQFALGEGVEDDGSEALRVKLDETGPLSSFIARSADGIKINVLDEDDMSSDSVTDLATQQSIKAFVENSIDAIPKSTVTADLHDPTSTSLPSGSSATIDGVSVVNGDQVLFTNLGSGNNEIYEVSGVGSSLVWTAVEAFDNGSAPDAGALVVIARGDSFAGQVGTFTTSWSFNENVRLFDGSNYQEISSVKKSTLTDNATTTVIDVSLSGSENQEISYSVVRGTAKEAGKLILSGSGSTAQVNRYVTAVTGSLGITFSAQISSGNIQLQATLTSTGADAEMTYFVTRWSDSAGGPGGIPNYATSSAGNPAAGTAPGQIQFRGAGGDLAADADFVWDESADELQIGDLSITKLIGPVTLNDNQTSAATAINLTAADVKFTVIEYSIERGGESRIGRLLVTHNGTTTSITDDSTDTGGAGIDPAAISFSATISGASLLIQYTTNSTGNTGEFKYSLRKWL